MFFGKAVYNFIKSFLYLVKRFVKGGEKYMNTLMNFSWEWTIGFVAALFGIFFGICILVAGSVALIAWAFYPSGKVPSIDDEEKDSASFSFHLAELYVIAILVLSAALALFRSYYPEWPFVFWSSFAVLYFLGCCFVSDVAQLEIRDLLWRAKIYFGRL